MLYRLVVLELGRPLARPTLLLLAVFPAALYFGAPYAESLFLALSVGAFYAARTGRWAWAGTCAAAAAATRNSGVLLMLPLRSSGGARASGARATRPGSSRPARARRLRALPGLAEGDALRFVHAHEAWYRELSWPLARGLGGARRGHRRRAPAASGQREVVYFEQAAGDPYRIAAINLILFGSLVFGVAACVGRASGGCRSPTGPGWRCRWCCR